MPIKLLNGVVLLLATTATIACHGPESVQVDEVAAPPVGLPQLGESGPCPGRNCEGEVFGNILIDGARVPGAQLDAGRYEVVLQPLDPSTVPAEFDSIFEPGTGNPDSSFADFHWYDLRSPDGEGCSEPRGPERHYRGVRRFGSESHCILPGSYQVTFRKRKPFGGYSILSSFVLDYTNTATYPVADAWNLNGNNAYDDFAPGLYAPGSQIHFSTSGPGTVGDHVFSFNLGAPRTAPIPESFRIDFAGYEPFLRSWHPAAVLQLAAGVGETIRLDVYDATRPSGYDGRGFLLHRVFWNAADSGSEHGWFATDGASYNHSLRHAYDEPGCFTILHQVSDANQPGVSVRTDAYPISVGGVACPGAAFPDFVSADISLPGLARPGQLLSGSVTLRNTGTIPDPCTPACQSARLYLTNGPITMRPGVSIGSPGSPVPGSYLVAVLPSVPIPLGSTGVTLPVSVSIPDTIAFGTYHWLLITDYGRAITEWSEANNLQAKPVVVGLPDLRIDAVSSSSLLDQGNTYQVTVSAANSGYAPASPGISGVYLSTNATWESSDLQIGSVYDSVALQPGATRVENVLVTVPPDQSPTSYYLLAKADASNSQEESNEGNNVTTRVGTVTINELPDLVMDSVYRTNSAISRGSPGTVTVRIREAKRIPGGGGGGASYLTRVFLSQDTVWDASDAQVATLNSRPPGTTGKEWSLNLTIPPTQPLGTYFLIAVVDATQIVAESDEQNNLRTRAGAVQIVSP